MLATIRSLSRIRSSSRLLFNNFSSTTKLNTSEYAPVNDLGFRNHYSAMENDKILSAVNQCTPLEMKNFNISQSRLKRIVERREKHGDYQSVEELLEIEGFGIKILEKFCDSILKMDLTPGTSYQEAMLNQKIAKKDPFVTPSLLETLRHRINSVVSFHMDLNYFAWTKICYLPNNDIDKFYVEEWYCYEIDNIDKKLNLSMMSQLLVRLIEHIPQADAYVMEAMPMVSTSGGGPAQIVVNVQKAQFYAMLCALMSARNSLKPTAEESQKMYFDNVFFLRTFLASRFYKYLIGGEKVASEQIVDMIFEYNDSVKHFESIPKLESINVPLKLKEYYSSSRSIEKEYLGNSLLVGLTFMKLCVQKCNKCIESLKVRK